MFQLNLWGNRCDLSISSGADNNQTLTPLDTVKNYEDFLICNHSEEIWKCLTKCEEESQSEDDDVEANVVGKI